MIHCIFESGKKVSLRHVTVDAILVKEEKIMITKRASFLTSPGKYALPGGFLDRDETTREGVLREVLEETGYTGEIVSLFKITDEPDRNEDRQNVTFTYLVNALDKIQEPDKEVSETKWFTPDQLPDKKLFAFDHFEVIRLYLRWKKEKFGLPVF